MNGAATSADWMAMAMPLPVSGSTIPEASPTMKIPCSTAERARKITGSEERKASCAGDRKSTRLNSSHQIISYAVFCLKKKKKKLQHKIIRHTQTHKISNTHKT